MSKLNLVIPRDDLSLNNVGIVVDPPILTSNVKEQQGKQPSLEYSLGVAVYWFFNSSDVASLQPSSFASPTYEQPAKIASLGFFETQEDAEDYLMSIESIDLGENGELLVKYNEEDQNDEGPVDLVEGE